MVVSLIACMDSNYGMGLNGKLPWSHMIDMAYFKEKTQNSVCIMGSTTYQEIFSFKKSKSAFIYNDCLLSNRISVIISRKLHYSYMDKGVQPQDYDTPIIWDTTIVCRSIDIAMEFINYTYPDKSIFFIGGKQIYEDGFKYINKVYLNQILRDYNCDLKFPYYLLNEFKKDKETLLSEDLLNTEYSRV